MSTNSIGASLLSVLHSVKFPEMAEVRQDFEGEGLKDCRGALIHELERSGLKRAVKPGMRIAVTAGSRGIHNMDLYIKTIGNYLKELGSDPFIVPAMGSHGGATSEGQAALLAEYGITEEKMCMPVKSSMEAVQVGSLDDGMPVYLSREAYSADGIVLINRVKPHTQFRGKYESGLMKILSIGLGKQVGAETYHACGLDELPRIIEETGRYLLEKCNVVLGVAVLENAFEETSLIKALDKKEIPEQEPLLLEKAKASMARIKFHDLDVLIVDKVGKNYSGAGMDTNITGRFINEKLKIIPISKRLVSLDLSEETNGNGIGIGIGDVTTKRIVDKLDRTAMYMNCITAGVSEPSRIPMYFDNDREAIAAAIKLIGEKGTDDLRIVRISNTLELERIQISKSMLGEAEALEGVTVLSAPRAMVFDGEGTLL